jgi:hypothetical protein
VPNSIVRDRPTSRAIAETGPASAARSSGSAKAKPSSTTSIEEASGTASLSPGSRISPTAASNPASRASQATVSKLGASGITPASVMRPWLGRMP